MSNLFKIYLLIMEEGLGPVDVQGVVENMRLQPLIDQIQKDSNAEVAAQSYKIGDPLPEGFILLSAPMQLIPFIKALEETNQDEALKRILPIQVPPGTAKAAKKKYPFPSIVEYEEYFDYVQNENTMQVDGQDLVERICVWGKDLPQ